jgi:hypothetical protein
LTTEASCKDEARVGQKGRATHVWFEKGVRPTAPADKRFASVSLFGAVRAGPDEAFARVMPFATAAVMSVFLQEFSKSLAPNAPVVLVLDRAGWHRARRLCVPENISLVLLPAYSPELNPVERVWLYLREQSLSHRVWDTAEAIFEACCTAWNDLVREKGRLASLTGYPYLKQVRIS